MTVISDFGEGGDKMNDGFAPPSPPHVIRFTSFGG